MSASPVFQEMGPCVCGCGVIGTKLVLPLDLDDPGHVKGCKCRPHIGKRNQKKGRAAQAKTHKALDGQGVSSFHEEAGLFYDLTVRPEVKAGAQVPNQFHHFIKTEWFRRALSQSERAIPEGVDARACVSIDGRWLVVDLLRRSASADV